MVKKIITIILSIMALILFSGCNIDVKELGDNLCKDLGYKELTDSKNNFDPRPIIMGPRNRLSIYEREDKYYMRTNLMLECDNKIINKSISYYDPKYQNPIYSDGSSWGNGYFDNPIALGKSCRTTCISKDKWGSCDDWERTCKKGGEKLLVS